MSSIVTFFRRFVPTVNCYVCGSVITVHCSTALSAKNIVIFFLHELQTSCCTGLEQHLCLQHCFCKINLRLQNTLVKPIYTHCSSFRSVFFSNRFLGCWLSGSEDLLPGQPRWQRLRPGGPVCCLQDLIMLSWSVLLYGWTQQYSCIPDYRSDRHESFCSFELGGVR